MTAPPRILVIAGSDSSGGAGIQADIKTITMLGGYAMTAITAVTAQNTQGVQGIHPIPAHVVGQQIRAVASDIGMDCIKLGMLFDADIVATVAEELAPFGATPMVLDPVMVAKGGEPLLKENATLELRRRLLPRASLVTPNIPEAELLTGIFITGAEGMEKAGRTLLQQGARAALVKGGHLAGDDLVDMLVWRGEDGRGEIRAEAFHSARIDTPHTHGTGCTLASAIATGLALGTSLRESVLQGRDYVRRAILAAPGYGNGHGPLGHGRAMKLPA